MGYTWTDGELITATKLNNTGGSGCATVELSAIGYGAATQMYGYIVYATYDDNNSRWVVITDKDDFWDGIWGFQDNIMKIIPPYLTVLPNSEDVSLFFVEGNGATVSVTGDIEATNLYFDYGSLVGNTYRITGDGSISLDNS